MLSTSLATISAEVSRVKHDGHKSSYSDTKIKKLSGSYQMLTSFTFRHGKYRKSGSNEEFRRLRTTGMDVMAFGGGIRLPCRYSGTDSTALRFSRSLLLCPSHWRKHSIRHLSRLATCHRHCRPQFVINDSRFLFGTALNGDFCWTDPPIFGAEVNTFLLVVSEY